MPTYQRAGILQEVVRNVLTQDFTDFELFVMDDGSTDGTEAAMRAIADPRLHYMRPGRLGVPAVLNEGYQHARGEYLIILHDHDVYERDMLSTFVRFLDAHPTVAYVFSGLIICDSEGEKEITRDVHDFPEVTPGLRFLREQCLPRVDSCTGVWTMMRRALVGPRFLDPEVGGAADVELWHRLCIRGDVGYIRRPLVRMRGRDPKSQFFLKEAELLCRVLRGKRKFIEHAGNIKAQQHVLGVWRRAADQAVLSNVYKCLRTEDRAAWPTIRVLAQEWGSSRAKFALQSCEKLPRAANLAILESLRWCNRVSQQFTPSRRIR